MYHGLSSTCWNNRRQSHPGKPCASTALGRDRNGRMRPCSSHARLDRLGVSSARHPPRSRALPSVLHLLLSGERRWLETVPASPDPDRLRSRVGLSPIDARLGLEAHEETKARWNRGGPLRLL